jgi:hypothetical protein
MAHVLTSSEAVGTTSTSPPPHAEAISVSPAEPLAEHRDRAERQLNAVRAVVLGLLATAALAYSPELTPALRLVNVSILVPTLAWTLGQYLVWHRRPRLPAWLTVANPPAWPATRLQGRPLWPSERRCFSHTS